MLPDKKQRGLKCTRENQLAITEFDRLSEKRDQNGKVQDDQVPAKASPHTPTVPTTGKLACTQRLHNLQLLVAFDSIQVKQQQQKPCSVQCGLKNRRGASASS